MKVGDVVQLPSGGPTMTVIEINSTSDVVQVGWFVGAEYHRASMPIAALKEPDRERNRPPPTALPGSSR